MSRPVAEGRQRSAALGTALRDARRAAGLTQIQAAEGIMARTTLVGIEQGSLSLSAEDLCHLAERYGVHVSALLNSAAAMEHAHQLHSTFHSISKGIVLARVTKPVADDAADALGRLRMAYLAAERALTVSLPIAWATRHALEDLAATCVAIIEDLRLPTLAQMGVREEEDP